MLHNFTRCFFDTRANQIESKYLNGLNCLVFSICYFWLRKKWCLQNFCLIKKWMMLEIVNKSVFEAINCHIIWYLFAGFKAVILCSVHSTWLMKYVFSAKIPLVKTSTRIVKYESRVVKSNPESKNGILISSKTKPCNCKGFNACRQ